LFNPCFAFIDFDRLAPPAELCSGGAVRHDRHGKANRSKATFDFVELASVRLWQRLLRKQSQRTMPLSTKSKKANEQSRVDLVNVGGVNRGGKQGEAKPNFNRINLVK